MKAIAASNSLDYPVHCDMNEYQRCHPFLMVLLVVIQWSGSSSRSASSGAWPGARQAGQKQQQVWWGDTGQPKHVIV